MHITSQLQQFVVTVQTLQTNSNGQTDSIPSSCTVPRVTMASSRIAFDASDSEDYSEDDRTIASIANRSLNQSRRSQRGAPQTPRSASSRATARSPRTPVSARSRQQSLSRSRISNRADDSPQPGTSRQPNTPRSVPANLHRSRKQTNPKNNVLREIWQYQKSTRLLLPKAPFSRLVRETLTSHGDQLRMQSLALEALQEATEMYVVQFMEDSYRCTLHRKQVTLKASDMVLVRTLRGTML